MAKKIGAIASLSIIGVLIIATIIMANIKINYNINCSTPDKIYVSYNGSEYNLVSDTQKDSIVNYINNASKENSLAALFNGDFGKKAEISAVSGTKTLPSNSYYYVEYVYNNPQNLMVGNKKYEDSEGNTYTYERLIFTVTNTEGENVVKVYVVPDSSSPTTYTHYYELEADLYNLYSYLTENNLNT